MITQQVGEYYGRRFICGTAELRIESGIGHDSYEVWAKAPRTEMSFGDNMTWIMSSDSKRIAKKLVAQFNS
jgi:hypothetical protein